MAVIGHNQPYKIAPCVRLHLQGCLSRRLERLTELIARLEQQMENEAPVNNALADFFEMETCPNDGATLVLSADKRNMYCTKCGGYTASAETARLAAAAARAALGLGQLGAAGERAASAARVLHTEIVAIEPRSIYDFDAPSTCPGDGTPLIEDHPNGSEPPFDR